MSYPGAYLTQQNMVGSTQVVNDATYYFRPNPSPHTHRAPGIPLDYAGGDLGFEVAGNPVTPVNSDGKAVHFPRDFAFKQPFYVHIDSSQRDLAAYPTPTSFRLKFLTKLRGVYSIEVLDVNYPNPQTAPTNRYVLLLNGLWNGTQFIPQSRANVGIYTPMVSNNVAAGQPSNTKAIYALAKMNYDAAAASQYWRKSEVRQVKYYHPIHDSLDQLEFTLAYSSGEPLDLDVDAEWSVTLEIVAKST